MNFYVKYLLVFKVPPYEGRSMKNNFLAKTVIIILAMLLSGAVYIQLQDKDFKEAEDIKYEENVMECKETEESIAENSSVFVQVCGCVNSPGVFEVSEDTRVYQLIELAGGFSIDADVDAVNQALSVTDGQQIYIPALGESVSDSNLVTSNYININTAKVEELMELPGVGMAKAEAIVSYREENGAFEDVRDIMNVSGIKEAAFNKIKDLICV